ncbi:MAG: GntR family transcriptional regulator [Xanthobacteraceae bacterium]|nr:GntR family transcriptional regulator [Xanthobacteraceae bacterium]
MDREFRSAEEIVFQHLRHEILSGAIKAQTPINQAEIAAALNVSRIPVRDALQRLQSVGLLVALPNRRVVVPNFTVSEIHEIFEMRALLEGFAARCAVERLTEADFIELETLAEIIRRLADLDGYAKRHEAFHDLVVERSGLSRVRREVTQLREMLTPYIRIHGAASYSAELPDDTHEALVAVLRTRDPERAEKAFVNHIRRAGEQLMATLQRLTAAKPENSVESAKPKRANKKNGDASQTASQGS